LFVQQIQKTIFVCKLATLKAKACSCTYNIDFMKSNHYDSRFTQMIVRLLKEYERSKDEASKHVVYSKDINMHDRYGRKTGKWITKYRHSTVEADYSRASCMELSRGAHIRVRYSSLDITEWVY